MGPTRILLCLWTFYFVSSQELIPFDSGISLKPVDQSSVPNPTNYVDVEQTGSYLFDANSNDNSKRRLSLGVLVYHYKSSSSNYFRAHPLFIKCIQKVFNVLQGQDKNLIVARGYQTISDIGTSDSKEDKYAASGSGIRLAFQNEQGGDVREIAEAALQKCPLLFERKQRNIGVILSSKYVHIHMTSTTDASPYFALNGYNAMTANEFETWCLNQIDIGLDYTGNPDCSKIPSLSSGQIYPSDVTLPQQAIGEVDIPVSRQINEDFSKLVQYIGGNIEFENSERSATWCGFVGNSCIDCRQKPLGNSLNQRCAARVMSLRMYNVLVPLQKLARSNNDKLKILKSFDEKNSGHVDDFDETSIYTEGRMVQVTLTSGSSAANMKKLSQWAICSGADFVQNNGDHVVIGVKKMHNGPANKIVFPDAELLMVDPPKAKKELYSLPAGFGEEEEDSFPLLDSSGQEDVMLADETPLKLFMSKDPNIRYVRVSPVIAKCYSQLRHSLNKHNEPGDSTTEIEVIRGFMSTQEQLLSLDRTDNRFNFMTTGSGFEIRYSSKNTETKPLHTLVKAAVDYCGPLFFEVNEQEMGIGLYPDRIFIGIKTDFDFWTKHPDQLPADYTVDTYREHMLQRFEFAVDNRIVDPVDMKEACLQADHPGRQSPNFIHDHPVHVKRRRRAAPDPEDCVPETDTKFCKLSASFRQKQVDAIWTEVSRKWLYHDGDEMKQALQSCFDLCGTCLSGSVYEDKQEACNNFLHWAPFDTMNDAPGVTNIFPRDNSYLRERACENGHCIEHSPLFLLFVLSAENSFRPDPETSVEYELYSQAENPNPAIELATRIYAIHASGTIKFWVKEENDMLSLLSPLKVVMLYNKNVTDVEVFVQQKSAQEAVEGVIETAVDEWSTTGCPKYTREIIAPFKVLEIPTVKRKRAQHSYIRSEIINHYTSWESRWVNMEL